MFPIFSGAFEFLPFFACCTVWKLNFRKKLTAVKVESSARFWDDFSSNVRIFFSPHSSPCSRKLAQMLPFGSPDGVGLPRRTHRSDFVDLRKSNRAVWFQTRRTSFSAKWVIGKLDVRFSAERRDRARELFGRVNRREEAVETRARPRGNDKWNSRKSRITGAVWRRKRATPSCTLSETSLWSRYTVTRSSRARFAAVAKTFYRSLPLAFSRARSLRLFEKRGRPVGGHASHRPRY